MTTASWLHWSERDALSSRLEALADTFDARQDYELWRAGILGALIGGGAAFVHTAYSGWLLQGGDGYWGVVAGLGPLTAPELGAIFEAVQAESKLVIWDELEHQSWLPVLQPQGAKPFVRQHYVQEMAKAYIKPVPDDGLVLVPWDDPNHVAEALELLAGFNAESLEGLFLTLPLPPSLENCRKAYARVMEGEQGAVLPWASTVALEGDQVIGALLCVQGEHERQGMLFEVYVSPEARGRQLSRRHITAMQQALMARGYTEVGFLTMAANAPVHQLFREEEIVFFEETKGAYWSREEA